LHIRHGWEPSGELRVGAAAASREEGRFDARDVDAAILHQLDVVRDLDDLARGNIRICEGVSLGRGLRSMAPFARKSLRLTVDHSQGITADSIEPNAVPWY